jgi:hypothetical protein
MKNIKLTEDEIVAKMTKILDRIIFENSESLFKFEFKIRPGYGYDKFYLNHTDGSFDMSLQSLIHFIMAEEGIYKQILDKDQFAKCMKVIRDEPEAIFSPSGDSVEDIETRHLLDAIYYKSISYTGKKLIAMGLNVFHDFKDYLNDSDYPNVFHS